LVLFSCLFFEKHYGSMGKAWSGVGVFEMSWRMMVTWIDNWAGGYVRPVDAIIDMRGVFQLRIKQLDSDSGSDIAT
jgi:hypothetical protein